MTSATARRALLTLFAAGAFGTGVELVLLEHYENPWQWVPVALALASPVVAGWYALSPETTARRAFQATMILFVFTGPVGLLSITEVTAILKQQSLTQEQITEVYRTVFLPINLNTATDDEILSIPGIGKRMLHEFKEYRPYKAIEQFRREIGKYVDKQEVARLEKYVTLS
ncbi:MAG: ComEA family DNA-binding protein [Vicinamibacterales bacterium]